MILGVLLWVPWEVHSRGLTRPFPQHCPRPKKVSYFGPSFVLCGLWASPGIPEAQPPLSHLLSGPEAATRTPSPIVSSRLCPCSPPLLRPPQRPPPPPSSMALGPPQSKWNHVIKACVLCIVPSHSEHISFSLE